MEAVIERFGRIDVLVNNVGLFVLKPIMEMSDADWEPMMDINAKSTFLWSKTAAKSMKEAKHGCIVNIASGSGKVGDPYSGVYVAAKHAVIGLTKNLALELAPFGVRVNAVCPVDTDTPMQKKFLEQLGARVGKSPDELRQETMHNIPLGRLATPEDIAGTVTFLASDDAKLHNGTVDQRQRRMADALAAAPASAEVSRSMMTETSTSLRHCGLMKIALPIE